MIKTITIGDKEVQLNNNIGWTLEYRAQFNQDIIPTLMPMAAAVVDLITGVAESTSDFNNVGINDIVNLSKNGSVLDAMVKLSSFEFVDFINITWALAKCADETIPEPKRWLRDFDEFPVDVIGPVVFELIMRSVVSEKNWIRLQNNLQSLKPEKIKKNQ